MVSEHTPPDSNRASRRSFLGAVGVAAGGVAGISGLAGAERSRSNGRGRGGRRGEGHGHSDYEDPVLDAMAEYAVPVASEGEVSLHDLVPQAARVAPPGSVGAAARAEEHAAATVLACELAEYPVVGLGESTHGTHEFHAIRRRIVQRLVAEKGLRVVAFEDEFSTLVDVNDYVVHGEGSVDDAMAAIGSWVWSSEEVRSLLEWLREFNRGRPRDDRVEVHGNDATQGAAPASKLLAYFDAVDAEPFDEATTEDVDAGSVREVLEAIASEPRSQYFYDENRSVKPDAIDTARSVIDPIRERLHDRRSAYVDATGEREWILATRHLRALEQVIEFLEANRADFWEGSEARDRAMAENVTWLQETLHSDQVVVWAHNGHVQSGIYQDLVRTMGDFLQETHGEGYYSLGFEFGSGSFNARLRGEAGLQTPSIDEPASDIAATLDELRPAEFFLDFGAMSNDETLAEWLAGDREIHGVGALFLPDNPAEPVDLDTAFDGLVFVSESTPTSVVQDSG